MAYGIWHVKVSVYALSRIKFSGPFFLVFLIKPWKPFFRTFLISNRHLN